MGKLIKAALGVAGVAAGIAAGYRIRDFLDNSETKLLSFDELLANQIVVDKLDAKEAAFWFKSIPQQKGQIFFLARITEQTEQMFMIENVSAELDRSHCILLASVIKDGDNYIPDKIQLVSFSSISESLEKLLGDKEYLIVTREVGEL